MIGRAGVDHRSTPGLVDGRWRSTADADRALVALARDAPAGAIGCTHFADGLVVATVSPVGMFPGVAVDGDRGPLRAVVDAHRRRSGGRAVVFPGHVALVGRMTVATVTRISAVEAVVPLGGGCLDPGTVLDTRGFVRPVFDAGRLVLRVRPAAGGTVVPFELRDPTPCCAEHRAGHEPATPPLPRAGGPG